MFKNVALLTLILSSACSNGKPSPGPAAKSSEHEGGDPAPAAMAPSCPAGAFIHESPSFCLVIPAGLEKKAPSPSMLEWESSYKSVVLTWSTVAEAGGDDGQKALDHLKEDFADSTPSVRHDDAMPGGNGRVVTVSVEDATEQQTLVNLQSRSFVTTKDGMFVNCAATELDIRVEKGQPVPTDTTITRACAGLRAQ
jgi:hypothetical protein